MDFKKHLFWYSASFLFLILITIHFFLPQTQFLQLIIIALLSMLVIMKSAGFMIFSISDYAKKTGLSDYLLGFVIVAICTSLPEISTAIFASLAQKGSLILGDVIGANIVDTTLVLGLMVVFGKKMKVGGKKLASIVYLPLALLVFGFDGIITRLEGIFLIIFFAVYLFVIIVRETEKSKIKQEIAFKKIWRDILIFGFSLAALLMAARWMVFSTVTISNLLHIPYFVMGLVIIALGTTIPELTVGLKSIFAGVKDISFGNIFGSFATNICLVLGIAALINPIEFETFTFFTSFAFMALAIIASLFFMRKKQITWKNGIVLLAIYLVFLIAQISLHVLS